jgi:hypothetical protein
VGGSKLKGINRIAKTLWELVNQRA